MVGTQLKAGFSRGGTVPALRSGSGTFWAQPLFASLRFGHPTAYTFGDFVQVRALPLPHLVSGAMSFKVFVEVGRAVVISKGPETGKLGVIGITLQHRLCQSLTFL
jgi:hypothetical protein